jgi:hypothetical protein
VEEEQEVEVGSQSAGLACRLAYASSIISVRYLPCETGVGRVPPERRRGSIMGAGHFRIAPHAMLCYAMLC